MYLSVKSLCLYQKISFSDDPRRLRLIHFLRTKISVIFLRLYASYLTTRNILITQCQICIADFVVSFSIKHPNSTSSKNIILLMLIFCEQEKDFVILVRYNVFKHQNEWTQRQMWMWICGRNSEFVVYVWVCVFVRDSH